MDKIETVGKSVIQYGKHSDRIYLMKLAREDVRQILRVMNRMAQDHGFTKLFAKVPADVANEFKTDGFRPEAQIPGFYNGEEEVMFMGKYFDEERKNLTKEEKERLQKVFKASIDKRIGHIEEPELPSNMECRIARKEDIMDMSEIFKKVFETYPFPIHDHAYLKETMEKHVVYFGVWEDGKLVAVSSSETDPGSSSVEMTDFATLPEKRGAGLATFLLRKMDEEMTKKGFKTAYTIARAMSFGMNITFAKRLYRFGGVLIHNTNIGGNIESMNVWYKPLASE